MEINVKDNVPLAPLTTMGVGGKARYWASCGTVDELRAALEWARLRAQPVQVLGGGSNTIFADGTYPGLVLKIELKGIEQSAGAVDGEITMKVAAGEHWDDFVAHCVAVHLSGIECLSGIPGLVGATPIQNVGAYGQEVAQTITAVQALDRDSLEPVSFTNQDCCFSYRSSRFKRADRGRFIITQVSFQLRRGVRPALTYPELRDRMAGHSGYDQLEAGAAASTAVRDAVIALRRAKSMVLDPGDPNARSAGSYFLNPIILGPVMDAVDERWKATAVDPDSAIPRFEESGGRKKIPAAWLVENSGFGKGFRFGEAGISQHHALAIVAYGSRAAAVVRLGEMIQEAVEKRFGIILETEPVLVTA
jgi:UDP-N-acetylmuramate dehydrogenase